MERGGDPTLGPPEVPSNERDSAEMSQIHESIICSSLKNKICCGLKSKPVREGKARAAFLFLKDDIKCINCWDRCVCSPFLSCPPKILNCICLHVKPWIFKLKLKTSLRDYNLRNNFSEKFGRKKKHIFLRLVVNFYLLDFLKFYSSLFYNFILDFSMILIVFLFCLV